MRGILIGLLASYVIDAAALTCPTEMAVAEPTIEALETKLRIRGQTASAYLAVFRAVIRIRSRALLDDKPLWRAFVDRGRYGGWCDDAWTTLVQNPPEYSALVDR